MKGGVPGDFFRRVFLDTSEETVSPEASAAEQLSSELKKVAEDNSVKEAPRSTYTPLDSELVKVAKLTIFFDTLSFLCKE